MKKSIIITRILTCLTLIFIPFLFLGCKEEKVITINFYLEQELYSTLEYNVEDILSLPADPEKEGYVFDGWYFDDGSFLQPMTVQKLQILASDQDSVDVFAKFIKYNCSMDNKKHDYKETILQKPTCTQNGTLQKTCKVCGYTFTQTIWATGHDYDEQRICITCGYQSTFKVTFVTNGGTAVASKNLYYNSLIEDATTTKQGYKFLGWEVDGKIWDLSTDKVTADITLVAKWQIITTHVSFDYDGLEPIDITYNSTYSLPKLSKTGYNFVGWAYNDKIISSYRWNIDQEQVTLTPVFEALKSVVTDLQSGEIIATIEYDSAFTLPLPSQSPNFEGWKEENTNQFITDREGNGLDVWKATGNINVYPQYKVCIDTKEDLLALSNTIIDRFTILYLTGDIDLAGEVFQPISQLDGTFEGNNHTISNLTLIYDNKIENYGLFGCINNNVSNLTLKNINIMLENIKSDVFVGAISGTTNKYATLENCHVDGIIDIKNHISSYQSIAGGLIGQAESELNINNCTSSTTITSKNYAGGLIGKAQKISVESCINSGNITSKYAGGLTGLCTEGEVLKCGNQGNISANTQAGGLIASCDIASVEFCFNKGSITNTEHIDITDAAGGLIGNTSETATIKNSYNQGDIISKANAGGLIGFSLSIEGITIQCCFASGQISGELYVGGIIGHSPSNLTVTECVVHSKISGGALSATISYRLAASTTISNCYYTCSTEKISSVQGERASEKFSKDFYINNLFFEEYNQETGSGTWIFSETAFPLLWWER